MPEANQTADTTDAREASMSRVQTQDSLLAKLAPQKAAQVPAEGEQPDAETDKEEGDSKPESKTDRFHKLIARRKDAEAKAEAAERKAAQMEAELLALKAQAKPMAEEARPVRSAFANDDDYTDAVAEWKARRVLAQREQEQAQARAEAEQAEIAQAWSKRQDRVMKDIPDYADVLGKSEVAIPAHIHQVLLESDQGPQIAYYLALHPEEAKRIAQMKPLAAVKRIASLERDLSDIEAEEEQPVKKDKEEPAKPQKSKAPPPIDAVKSVPASGSSPMNSYEEYKRRRLAGK